MKKNTSTLKNIRDIHRTGNLEVAKKAYLNWLRAHPRDFEALHSLGILYAQQDNFTDAIDYLQQALSLKPQDDTVTLHLANILKFQGLYHQAAQLLEDHLENHKNYPPALNNLGTIYYAQGKLVDAANRYQQAIHYAPNYVDAYYNLGLALNKQNDFADAISTFRKLLELAPDHFAAKFHLASNLMQANHIPEAIGEFLEIENKHPSHFETQTNLATCFLKQGQLQAAKLHYIKALELVPNDIQVLYNLGVICMQQGYVDLAIQHYQHAAQLNPNDFAIHNNLGVAFLAKQHIPFAIQHFREALRIQPNNIAVQHTLKILSEHQHLLAAPPDYVKSLFDSYADHYEPHLLTALDYQVPILLLNAVQTSMKLVPQTLDILDLGCGTGLCGVPFKPFAKKLIGVDLSTKMLDVAAQKNIYDELIMQDLIEFLADKQSIYDLILAGDVFVYIGDLTDTFREISKALRPKGLLVFNTEICETIDFKMNQSGRFAHHLKYLESLAEQNHLKKVYYQSAVTRQQNNEPVYGHILSFIKN